MRKAYGDPVMTIRMPREMIAGLKMLANQNGTSVSDLVRRWTAAALEDADIHITDKPIEGQITV